MKKWCLSKANPILSKPHRCRYNFFVSSDALSIQYDFEVYVSKIQPVAGKPDLRANSNTVPEGNKPFAVFR